MIRSYKHTLKRKLREIKARDERLIKNKELIGVEAPPDTDTTASALLGLQSLPWYSSAWAVHALAAGDHYAVARFLQLNYGYSWARCSAIRKVVEYRLSQGIEPAEIKNKINLMLDL